MTHRESPLALGIDLGTSSARALIVDTLTGEEIATAVVGFPSGEDGVLLDPSDPNLARQHPADYYHAVTESVRQAVEHARARGLPPERIIGIGVDGTGSTPIPVDAHAVPLGISPEFRAHPAAQAWLWKDHTAHAEAAEITHLATQRGEPYLSKCGGVYSSEWYWSKILRCERTAPEVARNIFTWVEQCDYIPAWLTGVTDARRIKRGVCAAGHKGMYHDGGGEGGGGGWGGLPSSDFLDALSPGLSRFRERFSGPAVCADQVAGLLAPEHARAMGLPERLPVAVGAIDAHLGAVGSGITPGTLVKIMGTSTCDCLVAPLDASLPDIPGVCGIVPGSILPGMYGIEAGQSAVGDIFNWFAARIAPSGYGTGDDVHRRLADAAARLRPGESGLLALDWHNGNRCVLVDPLLSGLLVGETVHTRPHEIYRALIEATAFGALRIIDRLEEYSVKVDRVVNCGGIAEKSPLTMQIYADVCNRPMHLSRSGQTCALGAAILGAVVGGAHADIHAAQRVMTGVKSTVYRPDPGAARVYRRLYTLYRDLHDAFGTSGARSLSHVMKELIQIRTLARSHS